MPENLESSAAKRRREESVSSTEEHSSEASNSDEEESEKSFESKNASKLYAIMSNDRYSDAVLVVSENEEIKSYRCLLAYSSKAFADIIDKSSDLPVRIAIDGFETKIVKAGVEFLCGNTDAIKEKAGDVLEFAKRYEIDELKKACQALIPPPPKSASAFFFWMGENRDSLKKPGMSIAEVATNAGKQWRELTDKTIWEKMAANDKLRYEKQMKIYQNQQA